ncbi:TonB-dependent receptor, partial [Escherichia coli]|nr:TonB-dependent receptor [Escherichia coli]
NKWDFQRNEGRVASLALRYLNEDRFGGVLEWEKKYRGSDEVYGESIYTKRFEAIGTYQLPIKEKVVTQFSYNHHHQDSFYGDVPYLAKQSTAFGQIYWDKTLGKSDF